MSAREERIVEALSRTVRAIRGVSNLATLLGRIMEEAKLLLDGETSSLFLYDEAEEELYFEVVTGEMSDEARSIRVPAGQGIVGAAAIGRVSQIVNDCAADPRHFGKVDETSFFVTRNLVATPMLRGDRLIGVLEVLNKKGGGDFTETDARMLEIMAEHAAAAIEEARLIEAKRKSERLAALGTASAKLSHYIKNVIQNWNSSASLIDMGLKQENLAIVEEMWAVMKRTQAKIGTLVKDMLTISKDRDPERAPVDLNGLAREILQESADKASAAEIELIAETDSALPAAMLDPIWMHDSMLNLVGNAIDALKDTRTPMGRVIVRTRFDRERSRILCETIDNGPGVPAEARERIFEPFYSTKGSRGSGLGLSVVRKYAEEHGGTLTLETAPGQGAAFLLDLPFIAVEGSETEESSLPARSAEPTR